MTPPTLPPRDYATRARIAKWAYSTRAKRKGEGGGSEMLLPWITFAAHKKYT